MKKKKAEKWKKIENENDESQWYENEMMKMKNENKWKMNNENDKENGEKYSIMSWNNDKWNNDVKSNEIIEMKKYNVIWKRETQKEADNNNEIIMIYNVEMANMKEGVLMWKKI